MTPTEFVWRLENLNRKYANVQRRVFKSDLKPRYAAVEAGFALQDYVKYGEELLADFEKFSPMWSDAEFKAARRAFDQYQAEVAAEGQTPDA